MKIFRSASFVSIFTATTIVGLVAPVSALAAQPEAAGNQDAADWASLVAVAQKANAPVTGIKDVVQLRAAQQKALIAAADQCSDFAAKRAGSTLAKQAKGLEAILLEQAKLNGDSSQEDRRGRVKSELKTNKNADPALAAQLLAAEAATNAKGGDALSVREQSARAAIADFPDQLLGYQNLVAVARDCGQEDRAAAVANDLLTMANAPTIVKAAAQTIADRMALVGQSVSTLLKGDAGAAAAVAPAAGKLVIVYSWSSNDAVSLARAGRVALKAPAGTTFIGICLDKDVSGAQTTALRQKLPGTQVYDPLGRNGALAQKLKLCDSGLIYLADGTGKIRSVLAHLNLESGNLFAGL